MLTAQQSAADLLADKHTQQQQNKYTVVQALLQLSPLLAEESPPRQAVIDALLHEVMPEIPFATAKQDADRDSPDLRPLCMLELAALAAQAQSITSLLSLPGSTDSNAALPLSPSQQAPAFDHVLIRKLWEVMEFGVGQQEVSCLLSLLFPGTAYI